MPPNRGGSTDTLAPLWVVHDAHSTPRKPHSCYASLASKKQQVDQATQTPKLTTRSTFPENSTSAVKVGEEIRYNLATRCLVSAFDSGLSLPWRLVSSVLAGCGGCCFWGGPWTTTDENTCWSELRSAEGAVVGTAPQGAVGSGCSRKGQCYRPLVDQSPDFMHTSKRGRRHENTSVNKRFNMTQIKASNSVHQSFWALLN